MVLIGMSATQNYELDRTEALRAGYDQFYRMPFRDAIEGETKRVGLMTAEIYTTVNIDVAQEATEATAFASMLDKMLSVVYSIQTLQPIVSLTLEPMTATADTPYPAVEVVNGLPGELVSAKMVISGNIVNLNKILRTLYFFAPNGTATSGYAIMTASIDEYIPACVYVNQDRVQLSLADSPKDTSQNVALCNVRDSNVTVNADIKLIISGKNQAPIITINTESISSTAMTVQGVVGKEMAISYIVVSDPDFKDVTLLSTSYGDVQYPPVTCTVSVVSGSIYLKEFDDVSVSSYLLASDPDGFTSGLAVYGPIDKVNAALKTLMYQCWGEASMSHPCYVGYVDVLRIDVNDGGYSGLGGALSAVQDLFVRF